MYLPFHYSSLTNQIVTYDKFSVLKKYISCTYETQSSTKRLTSSNLLQILK